MKKFRLTALLLALIMCLSLCACGGDRDDDRDHDRDDDRESSAGSPSWAGQKPVAEELDPTVRVPEKDFKSLPSLALFCGQREGSSFGNYNQHVFVDFPVEEDDAARVLEYIDLLVTEFGFEIVSEHKFDRDAADPFGGAFVGGEWGVGLVQTAADMGRELKTPGSQVPCDLYLRGRSDGQLVMIHTNLLNTEDFGHRASGLEGELTGTFVGAHALDAWYLKRGSYVNGSDGALSVTAEVRNEKVHNVWGDGFVFLYGETSVIVNGGEPVTAAVRIFEYDLISGTGDTGKYRIEVTEFLPHATDETIQIYLPLHVMTGDTYRLAEGLYLTDHFVDAYYMPKGDESDWVADYSYSSRAAMNGLTVRVLQWDNSGEEDCVVYVAMDMIYALEPVTVELILAAPANTRENLVSEEEARREESSSSSSSSIGGSEPYQPEFSKQDCLTCGGDGDCNTCNGYGEVERYAGAGDTVTAKCTSCYGSGDCRTCGGSGKRD